MSTILLTPDELQLWGKFIHELSGIALDANKGYLIEERLGGLLAETGCSTFSQLYFQAKASENKRLRQKIIDAVATHETSFFRDGFPFEALQNEIFPKLLAGRRESSKAEKSLRIWSAGCSTGQEAFSIAMILSELNVGAMGVTVDLLATDISKSVLEKAKKGMFSRFEIERGLSPERRNRYFSQRDSDWKLTDQILQTVDFRELNLIEPFAFAEKMDLILCRNVAIYFQPENKRRIFAKMARTLHADGFLVVGTTETMNSHPDLFRETRFGRAVCFQTLGAAGGPNGSGGDY